MTCPSAEVRRAWPTVVAEPLESQALWHATGIRRRSPSLVLPSIGDNSIAEILYESPRP